MSVCGKEVKLVKCPFCEKTSYSAPGLKCHITKKHKLIKMTTASKIDKKRKAARKEDNIETENAHIYEQANKIVDLLLDEVVDLTNDGEEFIEEIEERKLDETCESYEKRYFNKCDKCDFVADATRRYTALQQLSKHKVSCCNRKNSKSGELGNLQCCKCHYEADNKICLKKHMRDEHNIKTDSTSPPLKKKRQSVSEFVQEPMDVENEIEKDLSFSLEEMEIDDSASATESMKEKSKMMDAIIEEKRKKDEEKENLYNDTLRKVKESKEVEETKKIDTSKKENKKRKQGLKDLRKAVNKKCKKNEEMLKLNNKTKPIPNIKDIPKNCKHLVKADDVLYVVPGDGCCGPNSVAAYLFHDEVFGPELRRKMNLFMAKHWNIRYKNITQCSPGHPFVRRLGDKNISYTDPVELLDFLTDSKEAAFMWTDSEDLAVIADMYQIQIKVITTKGVDDKHPTINWIYPEEILKEFAELQDVDISEIVLLHENDSHFNLVINKQSDLALFGSLSHRFKDMSTVNEKEIKNNGNDATQDNKSTILDLQKDLKKCKESKLQTEKQYIQCEKELRLKTEEVEILKVELKDIKEILKLKEKIEERGLDELDDGNSWKTNTKKKSNQKKTSRTDSHDQRFKCEKCNI